MSEEAPSRKRGHKLEAAILEAAWAELSESGWRGFTIEGVAKRARTGKASIYARWPTKALLVHASAQMVGSRLPRPIPSTGHLAEDLAATLTAAAEYLSGPFAEALHAITEALRVDPTAPAIDAATEEIRIVADIIRAAQAAGELGSGAVPRSVAHCGFALLNYHLMTRRTPPDPDEIESIARDVWAPAIRASLPCAD
ncbi:TetR/AcrR family transcriptional regulator [Nocardioides bruguierae]|uniref:TetR/AcrR family transcriptional regulator n=1 Tax=Nocardioides bruguierae TaxID=2945102 RepID=UPI00201FF205|nr:TetR/AcrR family transcriptional regulator [Nocardioides bruguierae]MCL8026914.1 TetR/AcrR family transcriptional regulator [Nocardioides bruguierae]